MIQPSPSANQIRKKSILKKVDGPPRSSDPELEQLLAPEHLSPHTPRVSWPQQPRGPTSPRGSRPPPGTRPRGPSPSMLLQPCATTIQEPPQNNLAAQLTISIDPPPIGSATSAPSSLSNLESARASTLPSPGTLGSTPGTLVPATPLTGRKHVGLKRQEASLSGNHSLQ